MKMLTRFWSHKRIKRNNWKVLVAIAGSSEGNDGGIPTNPLFVWRTLRLFEQSQRPARRVFSPHISFSAYKPVNNVVYTQYNWWCAAAPLFRQADRPLFRQRYKNNFLPHQIVCVAIPFPFRTILYSCHKVGRLNIKTWRSVYWKLSGKSSTQRTERHEM